MGFFSGITKAIGGILGGGSSSANVTTSSTQTSKIENETTVNLQFDELADVLEGNNEEQIAFYRELVANESDGILTDEQQLTLQKIKIDNEKLQLQKESLKTSKQNNQIVFYLGAGTLIFGLYQYFKKNKKGKK